MTSVVSLLLLWAMGQGAAKITVQAQVPDETPLLHIGVQLLHSAGSQPTGPLGPFSVENSDVKGASGYLYGSPTLCALAASTKEPSGAEPPSVLGWNNKTQWPGWGWAVSGQVLSRNGTSATVVIEWRRLWDNGMRVVSPERHAQTVTLGLGDIVDLDDVAPTVAGPCQATGARLAATFAPPPRFRVASVAATQAGGSGGFSGQGVGGGVGAGSNPLGGISNAASGSGRANDQARALFSGAQALVLATRMGAETRGGVLLDANGHPTGQTAPDLRPLPDSSYTAELWLVQSTPAGHEDTTHLMMHVSPDGGALAFPSATITTTRGVATVDVASMLRVLAGPDGGAMLRTAIARRVSGIGGTTLGATNQVMPLPSASDVLSFEMPIQGGGVEPLEGYHFSLRVRIAPGK